MTVQTQGQNSPWKGENFFPIAKMGIESTVAVASLAAAITTILVATGAIAGPAFLASVANPVGITALFVAAVYFAVAAYTSYKQLYKNEEISGAVTKAEDAAQKAGEAATEVETKAQSFVTQDKLNVELGKKLDSGDLAKSVIENASIMLAFADKFQAKAQS